MITLEEIHADSERRNWKLVISPVNQYGSARCTALKDMGDGVAFAMAEGYGSTEELAIRDAYDQLTKQEQTKSERTARLTEIEADIRARGWTFSTAGLFTFVHTPHGIGSSLNPIEAYEFALSLEAKHAGQ